MQFYVCLDVLANKVTPKERGWSPTTSSASSATSDLSTPPLVADDTDEVVGQLPLFWRHFVGEDVQAVVNLHLVGVDDLAREMEGDADGQLQHPGASGAHHENAVGLLVGMQSRIE